MKHSLRTRVRFLSRSIHLLTLFILLVLCAGRFPASPARATNDSFAWAKRMGGTAADYGTHVEVDSGGNQYSAGGFSGSVDFDPGPGTHNLTSTGNLDIFVSKLDKDGNLIWSKAMGGVDADGSNGLAVDSAGNVYTTGYFRGTADFDPGPGITPLASAGNEDIFVTKLDSSGNFLWAKSLGGTLSDLGFHIEVDSAGNVYTTGAFSGTADFDPGPAPYNLTSVGNFDIFISKLDGNGNFLWSGRIGGVNSDAGQSLYLDASGVYTTGYFEGPIDFDPGPGTAIPITAGSDDIFVSKLDRDGNFVWARVMGGTGLDAGYGIAVDADGSVYTTGSFFDSADFDPGAGTANLTSAGNWDIFVSKLDSNGSFVWARGMGGADSEESLALVLDAKGHVYTTGYFRGAADFDPGAGTHTLTSAGLDDIFVSKLDRDGNFVWGRGMGGMDIERAASLALDASGSVYINGDFAGTADLDPGTGTYNLTSAGGPDIFIVKLQEAAIFADVPLGYWAFSFIERLSTAGITGGCATNPLRYCPEDTVTRAQMAVFLLRGIHTASYTPPGVGGSTGFGDVPVGYWAAAFIKQLAAEGITTGCGSGNFCPEQPVTRAQMAVFLLRSKHGASYTPPDVGASTGFGDVPPSYWSAAWIKQLVIEGITSGCGGGNYCPEQPVTRAQMAVFLVRTFNLP